MAKMMPLVQELTAEDVSKARVRRSRFSRKLFPVRYNPATATLATGSSPKVPRRAMASGETECSVPTLDERDHRRKCGWIFGPAKQLWLSFVEKLGRRRPPSARTFAWKG